MTSGAVTQPLLPLVPWVQNSKNLGHVAVSMLSTATVTTIFARPTITQISFRVWAWKILKEWSGSSVDQTNLRRLLGIQRHIVDMSSLINISKIGMQRSIKTLG